MVASLHDRPVHGGGINGRASGSAARNKFHAVARPTSTTHNRKRMARILYRHYLATTFATLKS